MLPTLFVICIFVLIDEVEVKPDLLSLTTASIEESAANNIISVNPYFNGTNTNLNNENKTYGDDKCTLKISNLSKAEFTYNVLKYGYNFVYLKLNFVNFTVNATKRVIAKNDWVWTYKGDNGAHQYLYIPEDFGYLSFGLLWAHTMEEPMSVDIEKSGDCSRLIIGEKETNVHIGYAMGNMTSEIASKNEEYNSSHWCYNKRTWLNSSFVYELCKNSVCTIQTVEYECCKFHFDYVTKKRTILCNTNHYHYGALWWILPIITGNICFAFFPLMLTKIGMKVKKISKTMKKQRSISLSLSHFSENVDSDVKSNYLSLKSPTPITVFSTLFLPIFSLVLKSSRLLRIWIIILPMCLTAIHVSLDYIYAHEFMVSAVQKGALVGFSAIIASPNEARKTFLYVFGGPIVATSICFSFGCLLLLFPSKLDDFVATGITGRGKKFIFLFKMPLRLKEKISGMNVRNHNGCKKLHRLFLAQILMLIHAHFWKHSFKLFYLRWKYMIFLRMYSISQNMSAIVIPCAIMLPFYILFCMFELLLAVLYYLFPVINCFLIVLNSVRIHYNDFFSVRRSLVLKCFRYILFIPMLLLFSISWYTYSLIFFDGFWFLSRIAMLTYSGIVAYPKISYGYLVLAFMTLFYVIESINAFGESYKDLLKVTLESCEKFQRKHIDAPEMNHEEIKSLRTKYGIRIDLFYLIVKKNLPRRNQLSITILKLASIITILMISVELFVTFDKFRELSLLMHVFTVLFVCALPKIMYMMCGQNHKDRIRNEMKQKVYKTISDYVGKKKQHTRVSTCDEHDAVFVSESSDYESFKDVVIADRDTE